MSTQLLPMLATKGEGTIVEGDEWAHQIKMDGIRLIADVRRSGVQLISRNGADMGGKWDGVAKYKGRNMVVDGEIVAIGANGLEDPIALRRGRWSAYVIFDLLFLDDVDLRGLPWHERHAMLHGLGFKGQWMAAPAYVGPETGRLLFEQAKEKRMEGIVSKRRDSTYQAGMRSRDWLKYRVADRAI